MRLVDEKFAQFCKAVYTKHEAAHKGSIHAETYIGNQDDFVARVAESIVGYPTGVTNGRTIFRGARSIQGYLKGADNPINKKRVKAFLVEYLEQTSRRGQDFSDRCMAAWSQLGFPKNWQFDTDCFLDSLTDWLQAITHTPEDCDVLLSSYQRRLDGLGDPDGYSSSYYPNDRFYMERQHTRSKGIGFYSWFIYTWRITNDGKVSWKNRKLVCNNPKDIALRPVKVDAIEVPDTEPGATATMQIEMKAQGQEGTAISKWRMYDQNNNDCFPTLTSSFNIEVEVINPNRKPKGGIR